MFTMAEMKLETPSKICDPLDYDAMILKDLRYLNRLVETTIIINFTVEQQIWWIFMIILCRGS
jgi:hypothetical protein